jgi:hypothetical protein
MAVAVAIMSCHHQAVQQQSVAGKPLSSQQHQHSHCLVHDFQIWMVIFTAEDIRTTLLKSSFRLHALSLSDSFIIMASSIADAPTLKRVLTD